MIWWYFHRTITGIELATQEEFGIRPQDAKPCRGNAHTPYYMTYDHVDEDHVHVKAETKSTAILKATQLILQDE
jgi:hypothetical protein